MKKASLLILPLAVVLLTIATSSRLTTTPSLNGTSPGCAGSSCHALSANIVTATANGLSVTVSVAGTTSKVGGELVDSTGAVVTVLNSTSSNPFTLTAPGPGVYRLNAGYKSPQRTWDSASVRVATIASAANITPTGFFLTQNYPNPFNPSTTVAFGIDGPGSTPVRLVACDMQGREVMELVNETKAPGRYEARFDGSGLPSGVYLLRLRTGEHSAVIKALLLK